MPCYHHRNDSQGQSEACKCRMESALDKTDDLRQRGEKDEVKENEALARKLQEEDEILTKKAKTGDDVPARCTSVAAAASPSSSKSGQTDKTFFCQTPSRTSE